MHDILVALGHAYAATRIVQDAGIWMVQPYIEQIADYFVARAITNMES